MKLCPPYFPKDSITKFQEQELDLLTFFSGLKFSDSASEFFSKNMFIIKKILETGGMASSSTTNYLVNLFSVCNRNSTQEFFELFSQPISQFFLTFLPHEKLKVIDGDLFVRLMFGKNGMVTTKMKDFWWYDFLACYKTRFLGFFIEKFHENPFLKSVCHTRAIQILFKVAIASALSGNGSKEMPHIDERVMDWLEGTKVHDAHSLLPCTWYQVFWCGFPSNKCEEEFYSVVRCFAKRKDAKTEHFEKYFDQIRKRAQALEYPFLKRYLKNVILLDTFKNSFNIILLLNSKHKHEAHVILSYANENLLSIRMGEREICIVAETLDFFYKSSSELKDFSMNLLCGIICARIDILLFIWSTLPAEWYRWLKTCVNCLREFDNKLGYLQEVICQKKEGQVKQEMLQAIDQLGWKKFLFSLTFASWRCVPMNAVTEVCSKEFLHHDNSFDDVDVSTEKKFVFGELLEIDEDQENEFKGIQLSESPVLRILGIAQKYIPAFLNAEGGSVYFGVEDDGKIRGIPLNRADRDKVRTMINSIKLDPPAFGLFSLEFIKVVGGRSQEVSDERYVVKLNINKGFFFSFDEIIFLSKKPLKTSFFLKQEHPTKFIALRLEITL